MDLSGHRLSDYPHSAHYDGPLAEVGFTPSPNLWVLEIAIAHPDKTFGAFYEDLLLEDQSFPGGTLLDRLAARSRYIAHKYVASLFT